MQTTEDISHVTFRLAGEATRRAKEAQTRGQLGWAEKGMRLARLRHARFMLVLERMAELLDNAAETQHGRTRRGTTGTYGHRFDPTITIMYREAYVSADNGTPGEPFAWLYGAAAWAAGL